MKKWKNVLIKMVLVIFAIQAIGFTYATTIAEVGLRTSVSLLVIMLGIILATGTAVYCMKTKKSEHEEKA
jgi:ABC-type uncharacterized transport system permease subunit